MTRQRQVRDRDPAYLGWVAKLPCVACMVHGTVKWGVHVAHLRTASIEHGKRQTGMQEKPADCWVTPLCPPHHTGDIRAVAFSQHSMNEEEFWAALGIDPFRLCLDLNVAYATGASGVSVISRTAAAARRHLEGEAP